MMRFLSLPFYFRLLLPFLLLASKQGDASCRSFPHLPLPGSAAIYYLIIFLLPSFLPSCERKQLSRFLLCLSLPPITAYQSSVSFVRYTILACLVMSGLNPLALEFYPCLGSVPTSFPFQFTDPDYSLYPPPHPSLTLLQNYPLDFSGVESPSLLPPHLSVYNNSLHLYLGSPSPIKPDFSFSSLSAFPLGVDQEGKVEDLGKVHGRRKSETRTGGARSRRRKEEMPRASGREKTTWVAKGRGKVVNADRIEVKSMEPEAVHVGDESGCTTLMIKNVPNKFT